MKTKNRVCRRWNRRLLFLSVILLGALMSSYAQGTLLFKVIELPEQNTTVENVLKTISEKGGFAFTYTDEVPMNRKVHLKPKKQTVKQFLDELFPNRKFRFIERSKKIIIIPKKDNAFYIPVQTIKGKVVDFDSKRALSGVNIVLMIEGKSHGTITDARGNYKFNKVSVGRANIWYSYVGYATRVFTNVLIGSGKEIVLDVGMAESAVELAEITIKPSSLNKSEPVNDLATISTRKISAMEMDNFAGAISDISRAAFSFPGVVISNDGQNHLIIRGNSPKGVLWRLEGIEIPNLNHFARIGASGGGVGIISNSMIANSDFFTSAFPAEYGNVLSGVFDLNMRKGNTEKHEKTFQIGLLGIEAMVEGPLKKGGNSSYIAQYRYSTLQMAEVFGWDLPEVSRFHDLSFKFHLPTKKMGVFSVFGIAGWSVDDGQDVNFVWKSNMSTIGISNTLSVSPNTFVKSVVAFSSWNYNFDTYWNANVGTPDQTNVHEDFQVKDRIGKASVTINHKLNTNHKLKAGIIFENNSYLTDLRWFKDSLYQRATNTNHPLYNPELYYEHIYADAEGNTSTLQTFLNWKFQVSEKLTFNSGLHFIKFYLNNNYSVEPRFGFKWQINKKNSISGGFGIHSRKESMSLYMGQQTLNSGEKINANRNLELTKSQHYILGFNHSFSENLMLKIEAYYQYLYDIPTSPYPTAYFSTINFDWGFEGSTLLNEGTAYNKGIEVSLEKHFSDGYYFLLNATLYESKFKNFIGEEYFTKYDRSYAISATATKEFKVGKKKQNILGINSRMITTGGIRYLPIDLQASISAGSQRLIYGNGYTEKTDPYFIIDLQIFFKINKKKHSSEWRIDIMNLTNQKNVLYYEFDNVTNSIVPEYQNPLIPVLSYRVYF